MTALGRLMTENQMVAYAEANLLCRCSRCRRDETINHYRQARSGSAEAYARHRGDLESADRSKHRESIAEARAMKSQRRLDHFDFVRERLVINPSAAPRKSRRLDSSNCRQNCRCRRTIPDSHLADPEQSNSGAGRVA